MWLIGQEWKCSNACSGLILIGRGLNLYELGLSGSNMHHVSSCCSVFRVQSSTVNGSLYKEKYAPLAQLVEQLTLNQWVLGSSPRWCTISFLFDEKRKETKEKILAPSGAGISRKDQMWPVGQAVKTAASHAANGGSIPPRVTKKVLTKCWRYDIVIKL